MILFLFLKHIPNLSVALLVNSPLTISPEQQFPYTYRKVDVEVSGCRNRRVRGRYGLHRWPKERLALRRLDRSQVQQRHALRLMCVLSIDRRTKRTKQGGESKWQGRTTDDNTRRLPVGGRHIKRGLAHLCVKRHVRRHNRVEGQVKQHGTRGGGKFSTNVFASHRSNRWYHDVLQAYISRPVCPHITKYASKYSDSFISIQTDENFESLFQRSNS